MQKDVWHIADFVFRPELNQLEGSDGEAHLEPRTTAVLLDLIRHAGEVRAREDLLSAVWDDAFVGEAALTHCIWELRKAFGDDARDPRFIQTVPRRGYRLIADAARSETLRLGTLLWLEGKGADLEPVPAAEALSLPVEGDRLLLFDRPGDAVDHALALRELDGGTDARAVVHMDEFRLVPPKEEGAAPALDEASIARIAALGQAARPGQILLTLGAFDMARRASARRPPGDGDAEDLRWSALGPFAVDGFDGPVELFEVSSGERPSPGAPEPSERVRPLADDRTILGWRPGPGVTVPQRPHWDLVRKLGEGGFGEVWLSEHRKTRDRRVFKFCFEAERLRALKREVTLLRLLKETLGERDDIVHLLDWNFEQAPYFLEAEYTSAGSLETWAESRGGLGQIPFDERLELIAQTAEALAAAHSVGVLHKDVKPANILVHAAHDGRVRVRLGDFGIGRILDADRLEDAGITRLGLTRLEDSESSSQGTRLYMAPETLEGREASTEADVYALGVVLYQVAAGAFDRAVAEGWQRAVDDPLLTTDVAQCLDRSPDRRPSARELADRLRRLAERREERFRIERERREAEENRRALETSQRRRRQWLVAALVSGLVAVVVSILAVQAFRARAEAEKSRLQAEELVSFMLGDLRRELTGVGRLDAMDGTLEKVLAYLDAVDPATLGDDDLERRAEALRQVGEVRIQQGDWDAARAVFEDAAEVARQLLERDPRDADRRASHADSRYWLGYVHDEAGDLDRAWKAYEDHRVAYAALAEEEPENDFWRLEQAYGHHNVASIALQRGELEVALADFQIGNELLTDLLEPPTREDPGEETLRLALADNHNRIGLIEHRRGRLGAALQSYAAERELLERLVAQSPGNSRLRERLATSGSYSASLLLMMGRPAAALEASRASVAIRRRLLELEPENAEWRRYLANELRRQAAAIFDTGAVTEAAETLAEAQALFESLEPDQAQTLAAQRIFGVLWRQVAEVQRRLGRPDAARRAQERSLAILETLATTHPEDTASATSLAWSYLQRGNWRAEAADEEAARLAWRRAAEALSALAADFENPTALAPAAIAHLHLGELERARPIVERLRAGGYRAPALLEACRRAGLDD